MAICIGIIRIAVVREAIAVGPGMLTIVGAVATAELGEAAVPVDVEDLRCVVGILIRQLQDVPGIGRRRRIGIPGVIVDHHVQRATQGQGRRRIHGVIVAGGWGTPRHQWYEKYNGCQKNRSHSCDLNPLKAGMQPVRNGAFRLPSLTRVASEE
jgi:hypothetical protein